METLPTVWFIIGIALMLLELIVPGLVIIFFGIGAVITAVVSYFLFPEDLVLQLLLFIVASVVSLVIFRRKWKSVFVGKTNVGKDVARSLGDVRGEMATVRSEIVPNVIGGKVEFHGTLWEAEADETIPIGTTVEIIEQQNLTLKVKPISKPAE